MPLAPDYREPIRVGQISLGVIKSFAQFGAVVMLPQGLVGHIPRDEISWLRKQADPQEFFRIGQEITSKVISVKRSTNDALIVTLSCRALQPNPWDNLREIHPAESTTTARVVEFLPFGATVQLQTGFHALLHDSEVSWTSPIPKSADTRQRKPRAADFLRIGETISVVIQRSDTTKRKIWVSHKLTQPCPWDSVIQEHPIDSRTNGFVVNVAVYGYFVQLPNGCVGLIHENTTPIDQLNAYGIGDEIPIRVVSIDNERRRISLSLDTIETLDIASATYSEGRRRATIVNYYERNPKARRACLEHYGATCAVCKTDFLSRYGPIAEGFIHVHHLRPVSEIGQVYQLDAVRDLRPVCPNCHAVIHMRTPPYSIEEVAAFLASPNTASPGSA